MQMYDFLIRPFMRNRLLVLAMGTCSIPLLFTYIQAAPGILVNRSLSFIFHNGIQTDLALGGSNVTVYCASGFRNIGGSLTIICTEANTWTSFPNCTAIPTTTTTTVPSPARCPVTDNTLTFANGFLSNTRDLTTYNDDTAEGNILTQTNEMSRSYRLLR